MRVSSRSTMGVVFVFVVVVLLVLVLTSNTNVDGYTIIIQHSQQQQHQRYNYYKTRHCHSMISFLPLTDNHILNNNYKKQQILSRCRRYMSLSGDDVVDDDDNESNINLDTTTIIDTKYSTNIEKVWRYVKKPLLSIGSKGVSVSHGNSLRQLLDAHTTVKVKINTNNQFDSNQQLLKQYAIDSGASTDIEIIQARSGDRIVLYALPGTLQQIYNGTYPPPPPPAWIKNQNDQHLE